MSVGGPGRGGEPTGYDGVMTMPGDAHHRKPPPRLRDRNSRSAWGALLFLLLQVGLSAQIAGHPVESSRGMVVSAEERATRAGARVLSEGGNAVDAAVAVGFVLSVTLPAAGNLGGGGFMIIHRPGGGETALDFRECAPAAASRNMFLDAGGKVVPERSRRGLLAVAVPGTVAGLLHAHAKYGKLPRARVLAPALRLAREGFVVSQSLSRSLEAARGLLAGHPESRRIFLGGGEGLEPGAILRQPELAATLERIAREGRAGFYEGATADLILAEMERGGGLVTAADLRDYRVKERRPLRGSYRGHEIVSMPPPSSGGVALIEMLNLLETWPISRLGPGSERTLHLMAECMRLAFRDRARFMGDPDFTSLPTEKLVSRKYALSLRRLIGESASVSRALPEVSLPAREREETTHFSVMDAAGGAVACTYTLNGSYGSGVTVTGAGFLLNNEMDDFAAAPGHPNMYGLLQGEANAVGPRKRPLSSMTPTLVMRGGKVVMVIGSPGGPTIINTVLQCVMNVLDHRMTIAQAVAAPRIHHQWMPDRIDHERFGINPDVMRGLRSRGHELRLRGPIGDAHGIFHDPSRGLFQGAADPRHGGVALGP